MQYCIIHGSPRKEGNTAHVVTTLKSHLDQFEDNHYDEFYLNKNTISFCNGCYNCFFKGESTCPHNDQVKPILDAMLKADGVIITTPVYVLGESGQVKSFMDHLAYQFLPHRPKTELFNTIGLAVATTAGAPTGPATKIIRKNMRYWGFKRTKALGLSLFAMNWDEAPKGKIKAYNKKTQKVAVQFYHLTKTRHKPSLNVFRLVMMHFMKLMIKGAEDSLDKKYWIEKGWL